MLNTHLHRRTFLKSTAAGAALAALGSRAKAAALPAKADSVIFIWLPGGVAQADTWDSKPFTPFEPGMRGNHLLSTCPSIPTSVDGLHLGAGLEQMASVMHHGTVLRSLTNETKFGAVHLKAQYYMMTGHLFPVGLKAPSMGAAVARTLGPKRENMPPYIYIGRDIDTSDTEKQFISEFIGPGFYGVKYAPFMIPDPTRGLATLSAAAGMTVERIDRRLDYLKTLQGLAPEALRTAPEADNYMQIMQQARAMMDSPVKRAFDYQREESPATLAAYEPKIEPGELLNNKYYFGRRFGHGLLLARRLVEAGARFVQVEYQYGPFKGFDMHEDGQTRMVEMKKQIDSPIAQLIRDLATRGLLERTLVVVATEFGRTVANQPKAGVEPVGFAESQTGEELVIEDRKMYGLHGHFSSANSLLFFGGGFKPGLVYGRTADAHPMVPVEHAARLEDVHATIYQALGIPADTAYVTEGRPFYVTKDGKGRPIGALLR
ncbi:MAG: DUF1501 domain-containing protein [Planctomycetota bacterium]|nr:MAG: DUF1501 domain-containing protein [Planctomycetota bacterium]